MRSASLLLSPLLLWLSAGCVTPFTQAGPGPRPLEGGALVYEVRQDPGGAPLYLAGSVHLGKQGVTELPPVYESVMQASDTLVVEVDSTDVDPMQMQALVMSTGLLPADERLDDKLSPETRQLLHAALPELGPRLPAQAVQRMQPWLVSITLAVMDMQKAGYDSESGVEHTLIAQARDRGMDILELETAEGQVRMLAGFSDQVQDLMLRDQLRQRDATAELIERMYELWRAGDAEGLAQLVFQPLEDPIFQPVLEEIYLERNREMTEQLETLIARPERHFVVVGAGHVVGEEGIVALLRARGYQVRQLRRDEQVGAAEIGDARPSASTGGGP